MSFPDLFPVGNPLEWMPVSRERARALAGEGYTIAVLTGSARAASLLYPGSSLWNANGPYLHGGFRYFLRLSARPWARPPASGRRSSAPSPQAPIEPPEPLERAVDAAPSPGAPARAPRKSEPEKARLRFDLAVDPASPGHAADAFVLAAADGSYRQTRTVKDDQVAGDRKVTLFFTGVSEGKTYALSRIHAGSEVALIPEVRYAPSGAEAAPPRAKAEDSGQAAVASGPGEVVACKVVIRECRIRAEKEDFYQEKESEYLFELVPASGKWVYVFGGPGGKPFRLLAEGLGEDDGSFRPVDLKAQEGKAERKPLEKTCPYLTLPLEVNGAAWDLYACLSPFQLSAKRLAALAKDPRARCYHIGAAEGGILWSPEHPGRTSPRLLDLYRHRDSRVGDADRKNAQDAFLMGLVDPMAKAKRRAAWYRKCVGPYLESRFDLPPEGGQPVSPARRRRKYVAGLLKVLTEKHPEKARLRSALAERGMPLDSFLAEENERELALKRKAEKAGAALVKWMDAPSGLFEAALFDATADPEDRERLEKAKEDYAYLIGFFEATSLTRLYSRKTVARKDAWVMRDILSAEAHQAARKLTGATVEILGWLGKALVQREDFRVEQMTAYFGRFVPGWEFEYRAVSTLEHKTLLADLFPDERGPHSSAPVERIWEAFEGPGYRSEVKVLRLTRRCRPLEKLGAVAESKLAKALVLGLEGANVVLALKLDPEKSDLEKGLNYFGTSFDAFLCVAESCKILGKKAGRGVLAAFGCVSAGIDAYLAYQGAKKESEEGDYDALAAQIGIAAGSASTSVGLAMVSFSAYSGIAAAGISLESIFTFGAGLSLTGAGAPVGAALVLAGLSLVAAGSIGYVFANDTELEAWVKASPFGSHPKWDFADDATASLKIGKVCWQLFPINVSFLHNTLAGQSEYTFTFKGPFSPETRIKVLSLDFLDRLNRRTRFLQEEVLRPLESRNISVIPQRGDPASLTLALKDSACWAAHRQRYPEAENGFRYCGLGVEVDLHGDGLVIWKPDTKNNLLVFEA